MKMNDFQKKEIEYLFNEMSFLQKTMFNVSIVTFISSGSVIALLAKYLTDTNRPNNDKLIILYFAIIGITFIQMFTVYALNIGINRIEYYFCNLIEEYKKSEGSNENEEYWYYWINNYFKNTSIYEKLLPWINNNHEMGLLGYKFSIGVIMILPSLIVNVIIIYLLERILNYPVLWLLLFFSVYIVLIYIVIVQYRIGKALEIRYQEDNYGNSAEPE